MSILSIIQSLGKSYRLSHLQKRIRKSDLMNTDEGAFEEFLFLCENDSGVKAVMSRYNLSKTDLRSIFNNLEMSGAGQWIKGHYVALSSLAYAEPLEFYLWCKKENKISDTQLAHILTTYFSNPSGSLYRIMTGQKTLL